MYLLFSFLFFFYWQSVRGERRRKFVEALAGAFVEGSARGNETAIKQSRRFLMDRTRHELRSSYTLLDFPDSNFAKWNCYCSAYGKRDPGDFPGTSRSLNSPRRRTLRTLRIFRPLLRVGPLLSPDSFSTTFSSYAPFSRSAWLVKLRRCDSTCR